MDAIKPLYDLDSMTKEELIALVISLLHKIEASEKTAADLMEENARLKGLKGRPSIKPSVKPSGMEDSTKKEQDNKDGGVPKTRKRRTSTLAKLTVTEVVDVLAEGVPAGSRFKGYEDYVVQDLEIKPRVIRYRRERWETPDGKTIIAPLPSHVVGHFGLELQRFIIFQSHQGQVTIPRIVGEMSNFGIEISKRQVVRILNEDKETFNAEKDEILRTGLETAHWITTDDTGGRHKGVNQYCTHIGNDLFAWFGTRPSKSRQNFLELLQAGPVSHTVNAEALDYMVEHKLPDALLVRIKELRGRCFDKEEWDALLGQLDIASMKRGKILTRIITEGALIGSIVEQGLLKDTVIVSDGAGQFVVFTHGRCWVHAERNVYKLVPVTEGERRALAYQRTLIWWYYSDLKAYQKHPTARRKSELKARFDRIFSRKTGFEALDAALERLKGKKEELLIVLDRPEIPLHTNGSENDIRAYVTKRKISGGTRSEAGKECRDTFLSLMKTCAKLGISFWDYLGCRLGVPSAPSIRPLPEIIRERAATAAKIAA